MQHYKLLYERYISKGHFGISTIACVSVSYDEAKKFLEGKLTPKDRPIEVTRYTP